jgi:hypothetical protein
MSHLVRHRAIDHEFYGSQQTIADALGYKDRETVAASFVRLEKVGWITVRHRGRWNTCAVQLNLNKVPALAKVNEQITPQAGTLAALYKSLVEAPDLNLRRKRLHKNWLNRSLLSAQKILNKCGGDAEWAGRLLEWGLRYSKYHKTFESGSLYRISHIFDRMVDEGRATGGAKCKP